MLMPAFGEGTSAGSIEILIGKREVSHAEISGLKIGKRTLNKEKALILPEQGPEGCDGLLPARMFSRLYFDNRGRRLVINPTIVLEDASTKRRPPAP